MSVKKPSAADEVAVGDDVLFVLPDGQTRPAKVVCVSTPSLTAANPGWANLVVTVDGLNDCLLVPEAAAPGVLHVWRTSVHYSEEPKPHTWHYAKLPEIEVEEGVDQS